MNDRRAGWYLCARVRCELSLIPSFSGDAFLRSDMGVATSSVRWDRVFATTTAIFALVLAFVWARNLRDSVRFDARLPGTADWTVIFEGPLEHPPDPSIARDVTVASGTGTLARASLRAGHYRLAIQSGAGAPVITCPLLVLPRGEPIAWDLSKGWPDDFAPIPPGPFIRGVRGPVEQTDTLFLAARSEVTRAQYREFLRALAIRRQNGPIPGCTDAERIAFPAGCPGHAFASETAESRPDEERLPASFVNWYDALAYAAWLTETRGDGRFAYRLPTAREWDKLAFGTDGRFYPWGNDERPNPARDRIEGGPEPVDSRADLLSPYGLFCTASNVAEWTLDAVDDAGVRRVVRGRSFSSAANSVRVPPGVGDPAVRRSAALGFRLVAEPIP
jgi:toxoflavin biosynthesis protein ToxD